MDILKRTDFLPRNLLNPLATTSLDMPSASYSSYSFDSLSSTELGNGNGNGSGSTATPSYIARMDGSPREGADWSTASQSSLTPAQVGVGAAS